MSGFFQKIMIVDDDAVDRLILKRALMRIDAGIKITEAENGVEALNKITMHSPMHHGQPDFIFLDFNMPLLDGLGFLSTLKQQHGNYMRRSKILMVSSVEHESQLKEAMKYENVFGNFIKPVSVEQILKLMEKTRITRAS